MAAFAEGRFTVTPPFLALFAHGAFAGERLSRRHIRGEVRKTRAVTPLTLKVGRGTLGWSAGYAICSCDRMQRATSGSVSARPGPDVEGHWHRPGPVAHCVVFNHPE